MSQQTLPQGVDPLKVYTGVHVPTPGVGTPRTSLAGAWALLGPMLCRAQTTCPVG